MVKKIAVNAVFLSASQIIARLIGFIYFVFLARRLSVNNFGVYTFTISLVYNFISVADFGIERLVLRDIPRYPSKTGYYLSRLLPLRVILATIAYVMVIILGFFLCQSGKQILYLAIFGLALFPSNLTFLFTSFLNAKEKMVYMAMTNILLIFLTALLGVLFVYLKLGLIWIFMAYPLANLLLLGAFLVNLDKWELSFRWIIDFIFWKKCLSQSWVFATLLILSVFYLRLSVIMVGLLKGPVATGLYGSAFKFIEAMILIPQSLALALFPLSSRLFLEDKERLKRIYKKCLGVLSLFSLPFALVLIFFSKLIVGFAYGVNYLEASPVLSLLGLALILFFVNALPGNIIQNSPEFKQFLPWAFLNFTITLALCLILIPRYSIIGAAWSVVGGEIIGFIVNNYFVFKLFQEER